MTIANKVGLGVRFALLGLGKGIKTVAVAVKDTGVEVGLGLQGKQLVAPNTRNPKKKVLGVTADEVASMQRTRRIRAAR